MLIPYSGEVALIKLAGYTLAGSWLKRVYGSRFNYKSLGGPAVNDSFSSDEL